MMPAITVCSVIDIIMTTYSQAMTTMYMIKPQK